MLYKLSYMKEDYFLFLIALSHQNNSLITHWFECFQGSFHAFLNIYFSLLTSSSAATPESVYATQCSTWPLQLLLLNLYILQNFCYYKYQDPLRMINLPFFKWRTCNLLCSPGNLSFSRILRHSTQCQYDFISFHPFLGSLYCINK